MNRNQYTLYPEQHTKRRAPIVNLVKDCTTNLKAMELDPVFALVYGVFHSPIKANWLVVLFIQKEIPQPYVPVKAEPRLNSAIPHWPHFPIFKNYRKKSQLS